MFQATTASTPASAAKGMYEASGAAARMKTSRKTEWSMPDTGPRAPERTLVAVRAMLPEGRYPARSEEHTSELQSLMRISYAVFCLLTQNLPNVLTLFSRTHSHYHSHHPQLILP